MWCFPLFDTPLCFVNQQELEEIRKCGMKNFRNIQVDEANLLTWQGLIVPVSIEHFGFSSDCSLRCCVCCWASLSAPSRLWPLRLGGQQMQRQAVSLGHYGGDCSPGFLRRIIFALVLKQSGGPELSSVWPAWRAVCVCSVSWLLSASLVQTGLPALTSLGVAVPI